MRSTLAGPRAGFAMVLGSCFAALLVTGCGSSSADDDVKGVAVRGRLLDNGKPIKLLPNEEIRVSFVDVNGGAVAATGDYNAEAGTFEITGPSGKGLPAGEYRVEIVSDIYGADADEVTNRFEEHFDAENTPLMATVGAEEGQEFIIDIRKKTITKK